MKLYAAVDGWLGVRYKYSSCSRSGVDCSGLVNALYRDVYECPVPRDTRHLYDKAKKVHRDDLKEGDLLFFRMKGRRVDHVGLFLANGRFVHASTSQGVVISSLDEAHYRKAFKKAGRLRCS
jgi:lipoprotein Spr